MGEPENKLAGGGDGGQHESAIVGCILGTAIGDSLGLPYEGVSAARAPRMLGPPDRFRFLFGRGMVSDDTEHTCMVAQSLIESGDDVAVFTKRFAWRLRFWFLLLPAGVGKATAISCLKLWCGVPASRSGVFSAGNGPAMRSAIFAAAIKDKDSMLRFVSASAKLTHVDPKAEYGALAVALAARESATHPRVDASRWLADVANCLGGEGTELLGLLERAIASVQQGESTRSFCSSLGLQRGVSGYVYHTVPACIHAWLRNPTDLMGALKEVIECGGDADTTAAIVGGVVGARVGRAGIPQDLCDSLAEWPRTIAWMERLGVCLSVAQSDAETRVVPELNPLCVLARNVLFLLVVLFHGFRRLAPPY
ncbi:MAG: ADP-ribosylglycohydrolase family protein [Aureliella sp.]